MARLLRDSRLGTFSFETYRLSNLSAAYSSGIAAHVSSWTKRKRHSFREEAFDGRDPIRVILFLRAFRDAVDHESVPEGAAAHIMPYFLEGPAA